MLQPTIPVSSIKLYHTDIWKVTVFLIIVKPVSHNKFIRDLKAGILNRNLLLTT